MHLHKMYKTASAAGLFLLLWSCPSVYGQGNVPNGATAPGSATARPLPYTPSKAPDYLRTIVPVMAVTDSAKVRFGAPADSMAIATAYSDGLGRPLETVIKQGTPLKKDYVSPVSYDDFGRQSVSYLPYVATTGDGLFKTTPFKADSTFYKGAFADEQINYSQVTYDGSPLDRVVKATAAGNSWTGAGVGTSASVRANTTADSVRLWTINIVNEDDVPATSQGYAAGSLLVLESVNESGVKTITYTDEKGNTVLSKQQISSTTPSTAYTGWLCTYFVYDEMNHLRFVITPKATQALVGLSWNLAGNAAIVKNLCYAYYYDALGRTICKRIPDKGKIYIAYDIKNRVVMAQDSLLRATSQWQYVKYDGQDRGIKSGLITLSGVTKDSVIARAARSSDYPTLTGTYSVLSEVYYDDYSWVSGSGSGLSSTLATADITATNFITSYNTAPDYAQPVTASQRIRGAVTGTKTAIIGTANYLYSLTIYDDHTRIIQTQSTNYSGGKDTATIQYSFGSQVLRTFVRHRKQGTNAQTHTLLAKYSYDAGGRLLSVYRQADGQTLTQVASYGYTELGQLQSQAFSPAGGALETQNFSYNIRGSVNGINKDFSRAQNNNYWFGEEISYDYGFSQSRLDGNIAGIQWRSKGDGEQRAYGYNYDAAGRLVKADFSQNNSGWGVSAGVDYGVRNLGYDANGNILSITQKGLKVNSSAIIDSLVYGYASNSNQLQYVTDKANDTTTHMGDFTEINNNTSQDYWYDGNGNYTKDNNKGISAVTYNYLNLPEQITVTGKGTIAYTYDAAGSRLQKKITEGARIVTTVYSGGFIYKNDTLQYALTAEGRIRYLPSGGKMVYDYFIKDHLGNVRMVLTAQKDTSFYPKATLETSLIANERLYYSGVDSGRVNKSTVSGYPADGTTSPNDYIQQLSGSGFNIGSGMVLKVMAGDKFNIQVSSWYRKNGATPGTPVSPLNAIVAALSTGITGTGSTHGITPGQLQGSTVLPPEITDFLNDRSYTSGKPKAYLNWVLLDEQFRYVQSSSGADQVGDDQELKPHVKSNMAVAKNGYLYVYVSNETPNINVYFDNLQVTHIRGPLLEESHYYPYGTEMAQISSRALNAYAPNRYKANGGAEFGSSEWADGSGLEQYETAFRSYDAQTGRFLQVDPLAESSINLSSYAFGADNPAMYVDPNGDKQVNGLWGSSNTYFGWQPSYYSHMDGNGNKWHYGDGLIGTASEGMQWQYGNGWDGFGDFSSDGGGDNVMYTFANSDKFFAKIQAAIKAGYTVPSADIIKTKKGNYWGSIAFFKDGDPDNNSYVWPLKFQETYVYNRNSFSRDQHDDEKGLHENNWYETASKLNTAAAITFTIGENTAGISRIGSNVKIYSETATGRVFMGNQYVKTFGIARGFKVLGRASLIGGTLMDVKGVINYYDDPNSKNSVSPSKAGLNLGMGIWGLTGTGTIPSVIYFGIDNTIGWPNAINSMQEMNRSNQNLINMKIINYSDLYKN